MTVSLIQLIALLTLAQAVTICVDLLARRKRLGEGQRYLAYIVVLIATLSLLAAYYGSYDDVSLLQWINNIMLEYLLAAHLLLFFAHATQHPLAKSPFRWMSYLPFATTVVINTIIHLKDEFKLFRSDWALDGPVIQGYYLVEEILLQLLLIGILVWSGQMLRRATFSLWLRWMYWGTVVVAGFFILVDYLDGFDALSYAAACALLFLLSIKRYEQRRTQRAKPAGRSYFAELEALMEREQLYQDPNLTRDTLAKRLGISSSYLSQQISEQGDGNLAGYLANKRVQRSQQLLVDPAYVDYTTLAIGMEAGFNSKATYYAAFRRVTGTTPAAFRKAAAEEKVSENL